MPINYFKEDTSIDLRTLSKKKGWINSIAKQKGFEIEELNYIFCSDEYLLKINQDYLNHNTYTDIITFDNSEMGINTIESDIFISIERVEENANTNNISFDTELSRVMIHGVLHLMGYKDKTLEEKKEMRKAEDSALELL